MRANHVSRLRRVVGQRLVTRGSGYLLDVGQDDVDALRFTRLAAEGRAALRKGSLPAGATALRDALSLWRGTPLQEFLNHSWAKRETSRLQLLYLDTL